MDDLDEDQAVDILGETFERLGAFDVGEARRLGVREETDPVAGWLEVIEWGRRLTEDVLAALPARALEASHLPPPRGRVLLHDDLFGEHVLVAPDTGRVTGIIDWADAAIGEPALDHAGLLGWRGERFLRRVVPGIDEAGLARARFFAATAGVHCIALGRHMDRPAWVTTGRRAIAHAGAGAS